MCKLHWLGLNFEEKGTAAVEKISKFMLCNQGFIKYCCSIAEILLTPVKSLLKNRSRQVVFFEGKQKTHVMASKIKGTDGHFCNGNSLGPQRIMVKFYFSNDKIEWITFLPFVIFSFKLLGLIVQQETNFLLA